jgi:excisionase family DNA binding protein
MCEQFLTVAEVATMYRVHINTVRNWIADGRLKALKLPSGIYRITRKEAERVAQPAGDTE